MQHIDHRLDSFFGPSGIFSGYILMAVGAITLIKGYGAVLLIIGALMSFTFTGTEIEPESQRYRSYSKWLGLFKTGKWKSLDPMQELRVVRSQVGYTSYSWGNRPLDLKKKDYRIIMQGTHPMEKVVIMAVKSPEKAREQARKLSAAINIPIVQLI
jgi:hypothetical protein